MNKKIVKNYFYNMIYQVLIIILPIVTIPYLSRVLGANNIGIFSFDLSIVTYFILIGGLGTVNYGQRIIAKYQEDTKNRSKTFYEIFYLRIITFTVFLIIYSLAFCINQDNVIYFRILSLELIANIFDISWFYQGIEDFKKVSIRNCLVKLISVLCIFLFVRTQTDLWKYFVIYVLSTFIGNITLWFNLKNYIISSEKKNINLKQHIKPTIMMFIPQIAVSIYTILDKTMLGVLGGDYSEVGFYDQSQRIVKILLTVVTTMSTVMIPRISNSFAKKDHDKIEKYMKDSFDFMWLLAIPISLGIFGIASNLVPWFFGPEFSKVIILLQVSSSLILFISASTIIGSQYLMSINKPTVHSVAVIIGALTNVIINFILIKYYGSLGAVIASCVAELVICLIEIIYVIKNKFIKFSTIISGLKKPLIAGLVMLTILLIMSNYLMSSISSTIIMTIISAIMYFIILLLLKDEKVFLVINKIAGFIKSKKNKNSI